MSKPIWLLDVDGVINALPRSSTAAAWSDLRRIESSPYENPKMLYTITYSPRLLDQVRRMHVSGAVELRWLTTWGDGANLDLGPQLGLPRIESVCEPDDSYDEWWKLTAARRLHEENPDARVVWTDDDLKHEPHARREARDWGWLVISPDDEIGLTPEHLDEINEYLGATVTR